MLRLITDPALEIRFLCSLSGKTQPICPLWWASLCAKMLTTESVRTRIFHHERNQQGKGNALLFPAAYERARPEDGPVCCRERLGGLLRYYYQEAA